MGGLEDDLEHYHKACSGDCDGIGGAKIVKGDFARVGRIER